MSRKNSKVQWLFEDVLPLVLGFGIGVCVYRLIQLLSKVVVR